MRHSLLVNCALVSVSLAGVASALPAEVTATALNVRTGPGTRYAVFTTIARGTVVDEISRSGNWARVTVNGRNGYVYSRYIRPARSSGGGGTTTTPTNPTTPATTMRVNTGSLNVRSGPGTSYGRVGSLSRGASVSVIGQQGDWRKISYNGGSAWVHGAYLTTGSVANNTTTKEVGASSLNVRSGPGTRYRKIGALTAGTRVNVSDTSGSWSRISYGSGVGWVHSSYLVSPGSGGSTGNRPRSRAGFVQLPTSGYGFYGYYAASKRWGKPAMVYGIERAARRFKDNNPGAPRLGVGDISLMNGGDIAGHASHELGVDADFRPIRNDRQEGRTTIFQSTYSRTLTQKAIDLLVSEMSVTMIFFNDTRVRHTQRWPNHDNHFHVRIRR